MKFKDFPYVRPDEAKLSGEARTLIEQFNSAENFETADGIYKKLQALSSTFMTQSQIAYIRHCIDTRDEFYKQEADFFDEISPKMNEILLNVSKALYNSKFRREFESKYGSLIFKNIEISMKAFSPEIISEMQQENKLVTEYCNLLASAQIEYEGEKRTLSQMAPFKQDPDDEKRLEAWKADAGFYVENAEKLDSIYDEMVKLRTSMAKKLGYENYTKLGYYRMQRNCYDADDVAKFRNSVVKYIVPIADRLYREQAERTGCSYPLSYADVPLKFRSGNPTPCGTADDILAQAKKFYHELSPETHEFIDEMFDCELMDVLSRTGKAGGGFCTSMPDYKANFIYANFNGTSGDVEVMTHEAGHAFAGYMARNIYPLENMSPTMESCEVHSMSMEFFAWPWIEGFFGKDTEKYYYSHLMGAITFIPYGTMVDHFQHIVYENPGLTPEQRHDEWKKLTAVYMPWVALDGKIPFYSEGRAWQRQSHIYEVPFYYIDYCFAQSVALQYWAMMQKDRHEAWEDYMKFVLPAGTKTFTELVSGAGLASPFEETALKAVADAASTWLDNFDKERLK